jgi:hypothetical protein
MPRKKLKVGMSIWYVYAYPEDGIELWEYVVKSIRKKTRKSWEKHPDIVMPLIVRIVHKCSATWVKQSKKHFDWGWAKNIPSVFQDTFKLEDYEKNGLPRGYSFTKSGAYKNALDIAVKNLKNIKQDVKNGEYEEEDIPEMEEYIKLYEKMISRLKGLHARMM